MTASSASLSGSGLEPSKLRGDIGGVNNGVVEGGAGLRIVDVRPGNRPFGGAGKKNLAYSSSNPGHHSSSGFASLNIASLRLSVGLVISSEVAKIKKDEKNYRGG